MAQSSKRRFEPSFENLSIDEIIGAPLRATATANSRMAQEQIQFLMDFCFKKDGDNYAPVMIEMVLVRSHLEPDSVGDNPKLTQVRTTFDLPLLTLIPINSLAVNSFELDFDMEITSLESSERQAHIASSSDQQSNKEIKLIGKISNKAEEQQSRNSQYQKKIDSKLSFSLKGGQLPLPIGLTSVLDLYTSNLSPTTLPQKEKTTKKDSDDK